MDRRLNRVYDDRERPGSGPGPLSLRRSVLLSCILAGCGSSSSEPAGAETDTDAIEDPECPELVYEGFLRPATLEDVAAYPPYTRITEGISLEDVPEIENLQAFACLRSSGSLRIVGTKRLRSLEGLERLEEAEDLDVVGNERVETLEALQSLRRVEGGIRMQDNPALHALGMRALEEAPYITIGNASARDPDGQTWYDPVNSVSPSYECAPNAGHPSLTRIDGLDNLRAFRRFRILGNENLSSIDALQTIAQRAEPLADVLTFTLDDPDALTFADVERSARAA